MASLLRRLQAQREVVASSAFRATRDFPGALGHGLQRGLSFMKITAWVRMVIVTLPGAHPITPNPNCAKSSVRVSATAVGVQQKGFHVGGPTALSQSHQRLEFGGSWWAIDKACWDTCPLENTGPMIVHDKARRPRSGKIASAGRDAEVLRRGEQIT